MRRSTLALIAVGLAASVSAVAPAVADAAPITVTRSMTVVSDGVNLLNPRILPGTIIEYTLLVENPLLNPVAITNVKICDPVPATMALRVDDYGAAGSGPVEFTNGGLLGLLGSGLSYSYAGLGAAGDGLSFAGASGAYTPTSTGGFDGAVREVCVTLTGTRMNSGSAFRLRYRVRVK